MTQDAFDTVNVLLDDLDAYIEERRWDETTDGGAARDKHFDIMMARSMRGVLGEIGHIKTCKRNPSAVWYFRNKTVKALAVWAAMFLASYLVIRIAEITFGLEALLKSALGL